MTDENERRTICLLAREAYHQVPPTAVREVIVLCMDVEQGARMFVVFKTCPIEHFEEVVMNMQLDDRIKQRILTTARAPSDGLLRIASITKDGDGLELATLRASLGREAVS